MITKCEKCGIWFKSDDPFTIPMFCEECEDYQDFVRDLISKGPLAWPAALDVSVSPAEAP